MRACRAAEARDLLTERGPRCAEPTAGSDSSLSTGTEPNIGGGFSS
jgi:hypothetical protein